MLERVANSQGNTSTVAATNSDRVPQAITSIFQPYLAHVVMRYFASLRSKQPLSKDLILFATRAPLSEQGYHDTEGRREEMYAY